MLFALVFGRLRGSNVSVQFLNESSFLPAILKSVTGQLASTKVIPWSVIYVPIAFEALVLLHSLPGVKCLMRRRTVDAHMLPAPDNMLGYEVQMMASAFTAFARADVVASLAQLMSSHLWFDHDLKEFSVLRSRTAGYAPLEERTSLEGSIKPMHDGPSVDSTALRCSRTVGEEFGF